MKRETIARYGRRGDQVRVVKDSGEERYVVYYRDASGAPHRKKFPRDARGKREAMAWAEAYHAERERRARAALAPVPITVRELWQQFTGSPAFEDLRAASQVTYRDRWLKWERFIVAESFAQDTTLLAIDRYITRARKEIAINQVRQVLNVARIVYNWGQRRKLLATNDFAIHRWKAPKDSVVLEPEESGRRVRAAPVCRSASRDPYLAHPRRADAGRPPGAARARCAQSQVGGHRYRARTHRLAR